MTARHHPRTLAKILATILVHSPGEYGLFWDPEGSMPWKDFHWALEQDPSLRFVREGHLREILYLGIEFPVFLDGKVLRLKDGVPRPNYPIVASPPRRLFHGCSRRHVSSVREGGLMPAARPFIVLSGDRETALRMAHRRDPEAVVIEVDTEKALMEGSVFLSAGGSLYLARTVSPSCLVIPLMRDEETLKTGERRKDKPASRPAGAPIAPGSFFVSGASFATPAGSIAKGSADKRGRGGKGGADWKRSSRKERAKREI